MSDEMPVAALALVSMPPGGGVSLRLVHLSFEQPVDPDILMGAIEVSALRHIAAVQRLGERVLLAQILPIGLREPARAWSYSDPVFREKPLHIREAFSITRAEAADA